MVTGAYRPKLLKTKLESGETVLSLAFTVDKKHKNYFPKNTPKIKANLISKAHGFLGSCEEYLNNTLESLSELNITDNEINSISYFLKKNK